jgi:glycosyltransferase involved in cell wall biosynthesis
MVGVQHFYIYDNESTDGLEQKLHKYIQNGIVTYTYWSGKYQQLVVYNHAVSHFQYDTKWLAIIDGDEYIVPVKEGTLVPHILDEIEVMYRNHKYQSHCVGGVGVQWRIYGTCGHKKKCHGLLFENYRYRAEDDAEENVHIKTICNPRIVEDFPNPHSVKYIPDYFTVSENGSLIPTAMFYDSSCRKLRLNHYISKSEEEFLEKNRRGWPDRDLQLEKDALYKATVEYSKVYDPIMNRYIDELKRRVAVYEEDLQHERIS